MGITFNEIIRNSSFELVLLLSNKVTEKGIKRIINAENPH